MDKYKVFFKKVKAYASHKEFIHTVCPSHLGFNITYNECHLTKGTNDCDTCLLNALKCFENGEDVWTKDMEVYINV